MLITREGKHREIGFEDGLGKGMQWQKLGHVQSENKSSNRIRVVRPKVVCPTLHMDSGNTRASTLSRRASKKLIDKAMTTSVRRRSQLYITFNLNDRWWMSVSTHGLAKVNQFTRNFKDLQNSKKIIRVDRDKICFVEVSSWSSPSKRE